jgi:CheY-like chemotaxis protein
LAIEALENDKFDLILMDVRMPDMDGFETTAAIRNKEKHANRSRLPIIALPAQVGKAEMDRCNAVGMDACLSKPIHPKELLKTMARVINFNESVNVASEAQTENSSNSTNQAFNSAALLDRVGGDIATFTKLISLFQTRAPEYLAVIEKAIACSDYRQLRHEAHSLKGAAANMGADRAAELASLIEKAVVEKDMESIRPLMERLTQEMERLKQALYNMSSARQYRNEREREQSCAF